jgi:hypothetical protein
LITEQSVFRLNREICKVTEIHEQIAILLLLLSALLILVAIRFSVRASAPPSSDPILGTWSGELKYGGETQKMTLRFELDEKKTLVVFFFQPEMKFYNLGPGPLEKKGDQYGAPPLTFRLADEDRISDTMSFDGNELTFNLRPSPTVAHTEWPPRRRSITGLCSSADWTGPSTRFGKAVKSSEVDCLNFNYAKLKKRA